MIFYEGKKYARVSDVLRELHDFSRIPEDVLRKKAAIGTQVHDAIHSHVQEEFPILDSSGMGYFKSFEKWAEHIKPSFVESETRYYDQGIMVTGCIDALIKFQQSDGIVLIDFKTSAQENYAAWIRQAHLYAHLIRTSGKEILDTYLFIKLDKNGDLPSVFTYKHDLEIHKDCMRLVEKFWENNKNDG